MFESLPIEQSKQSVVVCPGAPPVQMAHEQMVHCGQQVPLGVSPTGRCPKWADIATRKGYRCYTHDPDAMAIV